LLSEPVGGCRAGNREGPAGSVIVGDSDGPDEGVGVGQELNGGRLRGGEEKGREQ